MNIFDAILGRTVQQPARVVSPPQEYYLPAIVAGAQFEFSVRVHAANMRQYEPLNYIEIYNPSTTTLTCRIESVGGELFRIEAGSSRIIRVYYNNLIFDILVFLVFLMARQ